MIFLKEISSGKDLSLVDVGCHLDFQGICVLILF